MISRISLLKCKEGVSEEAFREGMMGDVRDVIARMPQLRKCEIDFVTDRQQRSHLGRGAIDIDGFIEMFFDSYGDMQQAMDEAGDALLAAFPAGEADERVLRLQPEPGHRPHGPRRVRPLRRPAGRRHGGVLVRGHGRVRRVLQHGRFQAARERARSGVHRHRHDVFRRSRACGAAELDEVRTASRTRRDAVLFGRGALL